MAACGATPFRCGGSGGAAARTAPARARALSRRAGCSGAIPRISSLPAPSTRPPPNATQVIKGFCAKADGKDKLTALVQYACLFASAGEPGSLRKVQASVTAARKVFRIMRVRCVEARGGGGGGEPSPLLCPLWTTACCARTARRGAAGRFGATWA